MGTETRAQVLWGAAGAKPPQWAKARRGQSEWFPLREPFASCKQAGE